MTFEDIIEQYTPKQIERLLEFVELEKRGLIARHTRTDGSADLTFPEGEDHPDIVAWRANKLK